MHFLILPLMLAQALRNLTLEGDPVVLQQEVARLAAEVAALRGGRNAAALELMSNELAAANEVRPPAPKPCAAVQAAKGVACGDGR